MQLSREAVEQVAALARLKLDNQELARMSHDLVEMITFVEQLDELNTENVEPMAHVAELSNVLADDVIAPSLTREDALANAPKQDGEYYLVPAVL